MITFDLNAISSKSKKGETVKDYLIHKRSICKYLCIMSAVVPLNFAFQYYFSSFYGLNRLSEEKRGNFYKVFDDYTKKVSSTYTYQDILTDLANPASGTGRVEMSFGSKMLHTLNPDEPIIDSIVIKNLQADPNTVPYLEGVVKQSYTIADAVNLHNALKDCYIKYLIPHAKKVGYFDVFDSEFPFAKNISEVKKIDFYLWTM